MRELIITLSIVLGLPASAQIPGLPTNLLSPNAASLGEYGEVPVSLYTGIPDISIPLYTIELGEYSVPISMTYHAGGVRPDQHVGWTGAGWTLNAGGCISRIVNGIADEYHIDESEYTGTYYIKPTEIGFYYKHSILNFEWTDDSIAMQQRIKNMVKTDTVYWDTEPDRFIFNFMGYYGNFYLDTNGEWQVQCNKPIKVIFNNDFTREYSEKSISMTGIEETSIERYGRTHSFKTFTIIAEDGTKYIFGDEENAIEYSMDFFNQYDSPFIAGTWYLTKIIFPNKREVKFAYSRGSHIAQFFNTRMDYTESSTKGCYISTGYAFGYFGGKLIVPTYLFKIEFDGGYIITTRTKSNDLQYDYTSIMYQLERSFSSTEYNKLKYLLPILRHNGSYEGEKYYPNCLNGLRWQKLSILQIVNSENKTIKKFKFDYIENSTQRLLLKSISEIGAFSQDTGRVYKFEYHKPESLPGYVSRQVDHWGFYNGRSYSISTEENAYFSGRETNPEVAQYGILNKIIYPTGGFSKFIYESHDYQKQVGIYRDSYETLSSKKYAGGLRIKRIVNSPSGLEQDTCTIKEYFYVSDFLANKGAATKSSGILCQRAKYNFSNHRVKSPDDEVTFFVDVFSSQSVLPFSDNSYSSHIGYSQVVERLSDGSFSIYKFSNYDTGNCDKRADATLQGHTIYEPYSSRGQERGLLLSKNEYDNKGNKTRSTCHTYEKDRPESNFIKALHIKQTEFGCGKFYEATAYRNFLYTMRPTQMNDTVFRGGKAFASETAYSYNNNRLPSQTTQSMENNEIRRITYRYPDSFVSERSAKYKEMCDCNRISPVVEQIVEAIDKDGIIIPVQKTRCHYDDNIVKPSSIDVAYGTNAYEEVKHRYFDKFYNIYYEEDFEYDSASGCLWGYKGLYPVALVKYFDIWSIVPDIDAFAASDTPDFSILDNRREDIPEAAITTFSYIPLVGISEKVEPNGNITQYVYDSLGRLSCIKDKNGNILQHYKYNY